MSATVPEDDHTLLQYLQASHYPHTRNVDADPDCRFTLIQPLAILISPLASRIYLRAALGLISSFVLLCLSIAAYAIFYYTYIPDLGFVLPLHLQFSPNHAHHPFALAQIPRGIVDNHQPYGVTVCLCLPVTADNVLVGNFMINTEIRGPEEAKTPADPVANGQEATELVSRVLSHSSRPALLMPEDRLVSTVRRLLQLPLLVAGWTREVSCMRVPILERVTFDRGWHNQPDVVKVEIAVQGGPLRTLRVLEASVEWVAVLGGLRYAIWNHRVISAITGVSMFWLTSTMIASLMWAGLSILLAAPGREKQQPSRSPSTKYEEPSTPSFVSLPAGGPAVKVSGSDVGESQLMSSLKEEEADDEDEGPEILTKLNQATG